MWRCKLWHDARIGDIRLSPGWNRNAPINFSFSKGAPERRYRCRMDLLPCYASFASGWINHATMMAYLNRYVWRASIAKWLFLQMLRNLYNVRWTIKNTNLSSVTPCGKSRKHLPLKAPLHNWTATIPNMANIKKQMARTFHSIGKVSNNNVTRILIPVNDHRNNGWK